MRGAKVVVRLFPHEVVDVEPVLALLSRQNPENHAVSKTLHSMSSVT